MPSPISPKSEFKYFYFENPTFYHVLQVFINFATQQQGVPHSSQGYPAVHHDRLPV